MADVILKMSLPVFMACLRRSVQGGKAHRNNVPYDTTLDETFEILVMAILPSTGA